MPTPPALDGRQLSEKTQPPHGPHDEATAASGEGAGDLVAIITERHRQLQQRVAADLEDHRNSLLQDVANLQQGRWSLDNTTEMGSPKNVPSGRPSGISDNERHLNSRLPLPPGGMKHLPPDAARTSRASGRRTSRDSRESGEEPSARRGSLDLESSASADQHARGDQRAISLSATMDALSVSRATILRSPSSVGRSQEPQAIHNIPRCVSAIATFARSVKERREFDLIVAVVIIVNAITIGFEADWRMQNATMGSPEWLMITEWVFFTVFVGELLVRITAEGLDFARPSNPLFPWNVFDSLVTASAALELLAVSRHLNFTVARLCRVMRLARVLRFIRLLKGFRELRMMVMGIMSCGRTLLWSFIILTIATYTYAVFILHTSSDWLAGISEHEDTSFVNANFGSLPRSMYTLYLTVLHGIDWGTISDPLFDINLALPISFMIYMAVSVLVILNIITATFVQAAARAAADEDSKFLDVLEDKKVWLEKITNMFKNYTPDSKQCLDWPTFREVMKRTEAQMLFAEVGFDLDYQRIADLFPLFDVDNDGVVDIHEFVQGLSLFRGPARSVDMFRHFRQLDLKLDRILRRSRRGSQVESGHEDADDAESEE